MYYAIAALRTVRLTQALRSIARRWETNDAAPESGEDAWFARDLRIRRDEWQCYCLKFGHRTPD